jgi:hypothetical protein
MKTPLGVGERGIESFCVYRKLGLDFLERPRPRRRVQAIVDAAFEGQVEAGTADPGHCRRSGGLDLETGNGGVWFHLTRTEIWISRPSRLGKMNDPPDRATASGVAPKIRFPEFFRQEIWRAALRPAEMW